MVVESVFVLAAVTGFIEFCKRLRDQDWNAAVIILGAAVIGTLAGVAEIEGLTATSGFIVGLGAPGVYTLVTQVSKR